MCYYLGNCCEDDAADGACDLLLEPGVDAADVENVAAEWKFSQQFRVAVLH